MAVSWLLMEVHVVLWYGTTMVLTMGCIHHAATTRKVNGKKNKEKDPK
jgi:hypothetical protein